MWGYLRDSPTIFYFMKGSRNGISKKNKGI